MAKQVREIRECENCHAEMQTLGKLPAIGAKPLIKVFGCYVCNRIEADTLSVCGLAKHTASTNCEVGVMKLKFRSR
jgi:hypothetical protein